MKLSILLGLIVLTFVGVSSVGCTKNDGKGTEKTVTGYITDSMCGLDHTAMKMGNDKECTEKCVEAGSKFALADRAHKLVYTLDDAGQQTARPFAGQQVEVTGRVDSNAKTIQVTAIRPTQ